MVPQVQHLLLRYVQDQDKDLRILQQCDRYRDITLTQLNVRPAFVSKELEPFTESIAHLRFVYVCVCDLLSLLVYKSEILISVIAISHLSRFHFF